MIAETSTGAVALTPQRPRGRYVQCPRCPKRHTRITTALCKACERTEQERTWRRGFQRRRALARQRVLPWIPPMRPGERARQYDLFHWSSVVQGLRQDLVRAYIQGQISLEQFERDAGGDRLYRQAGQAMAQLAEPTWRTLRRDVYWRDGGICMVCGYECDDDGGVYWCGHIIDRCIGGPDAMWNLVVQCCTCNYYKDLTRTREAYVPWARQGSPVGTILRSAVKQLTEPGPVLTV